MLKKLFYFGLVSIFGSLIFLLPALAQNPPAALHNCPPDKTLQECQELYLNQVGDTSGYGPADPEIQTTTVAEKIGTIISYALGFLGIIFFILIIYAGLQWMTSSDKEKIAKAQSMIRNAVIGLVVVLAAYAITWFVVTQIRSSINDTEVASCSSFVTEAECLAASCTWDASGNICSE